MRVYLPATLPLLAGARSRGAFAGPLQAHAVTAAVREWYVQGDLEELEYSALMDAAQSSLRLLARDAHAAHRRVVVALEVPDEDVRAAGTQRSSVHLAGPVPLTHAVSVHVDDAAAGAVVREAMAALPAADAGDEEARFLLDEAEAHDLLWYDATELEGLLDQSDQ